MAWCEAGRDGSGSGRGGVAFAREQLATEGIEVAITSLRRFCAWFQLRELLEQARDSEDLIDLDPAELARAHACAQKLDLALPMLTLATAATCAAERAHACAQKLLLDLALAERNARLLTLATAAVDRQRRLDLQSARDTWRQRQRERQWTQTVALREKALQLARDRFEDSKMRYERAHRPPPKPTGLTPEVLRQIEEAAKLL